MERKKGVTTTVIVLAVVIMFIILTTATVVGSRNIDTVNYEEYKSQLTRVSNSLNEYVIKNDELPTKGQIVVKANLTEDLTKEITENGDINNDLYIVDMTKLNVNNINKGSGNIDDRDIFLVAEYSNNIYYYKGYKFRGTMYYGV